MFNKLSKRTPFTNRKVSGFIIGQDVSSTVITNSSTENLSIFYFLSVPDAIDGYNLGVAKIYDPNRKNSSNIFDNSWHVRTKFIEDEYYTITVPQYSIRTITSYPQPTNKGTRFNYIAMASDGTLPSGFTYNPKTRKLIVVNDKFVVDGTGVISQYSLDSDTLSNYANVNLGISTSFVYLTISDLTFTPTRHIIFAGGGQVSVSSNDGQSWASATSLPSTPISGGIFANSKYVVLKASSSTGVSIYTTSNVQTSWSTPYSDSDINYATSRSGQTIAYSSNTNTFIACVHRLISNNSELAIVRSTDGGSTWTKTNTGLNIRPSAIASTDDGIFVVSGFFYNSTTTASNVLAKVAISIDNGVNWRLADTRDISSNTLINCASFNIEYGGY